MIQLWRSFGAFDARCRFSTSDDEHLVNALDETATQSPEVQALYRFIEKLDLRRSRRLLA